MNKKVSKNIKLLITLLIVFGLVWFLVISPMITFHKNEKAMEDAAKRYFEINTSELPTGERIKTVSLKTLYHKAYLKEDLKVPYSGKRCSVSDSWVKVKRVDNDYEYYTYLKCGLLSSTVDHKGPEIKLNGDAEIVVGIGEEFQDPGVKSIVDNKDGKLDVERVTIRGDVDTYNVGTYTIEYSALDSLNNRTVVKRSINVVQKLSSTIKAILPGTDHFKGNPDNNFVYLSNMMFRVVGMENNDVIVVADEDVSNVNFTKIDEWLDYYYDHLNDTTKKMIVERKYCNMTLTDTTLDTTQCNRYTKERKIYIPSVVEVNLAESDGDNFMKPYTMSWVANAKSKKEAYLTRNVFWDEDEGKNFVSYPSTHNYGIRPMMMLDGESLITGGTGEPSDPYIFEDFKPAKSGTYVNERSTGEYLEIGGMLYRIVEVDKDGTTRVISRNTIGNLNENVETLSNMSNNKITYNPKDSSSAAYFINNRVSEYIDSTYFENHTIEVPIYKGDIIYGEESSVKKYKVKVSAPNLYEMFAAQPQGYSNCASYWLVNTSTKGRRAGAISLVGVPLNRELDADLSLGIRVVGYVKKDTVISSGSGTLNSPYQIK